MQTASYSLMNISYMNVASFRCHLVCPNKGHNDKTTLWNPHLKKLPDIVFKYEVEKHEIQACGNREKIDR